MSSVVRRARAGVRRSELPLVAACGLAAAGVVDSWLSAWLSPVGWAAIMIASALIVSASHLGGRRRSSDDAGRILVPLGLLLLALLHVATIAPTVPAAAIPLVHEHGVVGDARAVVPLACLSAVGYGVASLIVRDRVGDSAARRWVLPMAAAVLCMAGGLVARS